MTVEASRGPVASRRCALGTGAYTGPATEADAEFDNFSPLRVQVAPVALQSLVAGSCTMTPAFPDGSTDMRH